MIFNNFSIILAFVSLIIQLVFCEFSMPNDAEIKRQWNIFKTTHNVRLTRVDGRKKFLNFKNNYLRVMQHNYKYAQNETDFLLEVNELSLLSEHEYKSTRLGAFVDLDKYLSQMSQRANVQHSEERITNENDTISRPSALRPLTASNGVDWLAQGFMSPVKNQLTCGSCWAFAAAGVIESLYVMKFGAVKDFSEQSLIDCDSNRAGQSTSLMNYGCTGGWPEAAFDYIKYNGIVEEMFYPYRNSDRSSCDQSRLNHLKVKISGWSNVASGDEYSLANAVSTYGPVAIGVDASEWKFAHYKSGIYNSNECSSQDVNHAVIVAGYGTENGQDYWIIKNSWGSNWGMGGYMKLARNRRNMCGVATVATYAY